MTINYVTQAIVWLVWQWGSMRQQVSYVVFFAIRFSTLRVSEEVLWFVLVIQE